jgi:YVTN family beta-propeller protein
LNKNRSFKRSESIGRATKKILVVTLLMLFMDSAFGTPIVVSGSSGEGDSTSYGLSCGFSVGNNYANDPTMAVSSWVQCYYEETIIAPANSPQIPTGVASFAAFDLYGNPSRPGTAGVFDPGNGVCTLAPLNPHITPLNGSGIFIPLNATGYVENTAACSVYFQYTPDFIKNGPCILVCENTPIEIEADLEGTPSGTYTCALSSGSPDPSCAHTIETFVTCWMDVGGCALMATPGGGVSDYMCIIGNWPHDPLGLTDCKQLDTDYTNPPTGWDLTNQGIELPGATMWAALASVIPNEGCVGVSTAIAQAVGYGYQLGPNPGQIDTASLIAACNTPGGFYTFLTGAELSQAAGGKAVVDGNTLSLLAPLVTGLGPAGATIVGSVAVLVDAVCGFANYYCFGSNITATMMANPLDIQAKPIPMELAQLGNLPSTAFATWGSTIAWSLPSCTNASFCKSMDSLCGSNANLQNGCVVSPACKNNPTCSSPAIPGSAVQDDSYNPNAVNYADFNTNAPIQCAVGYVNGQSIGYDGDLDFNINSTSPLNPGVSVNYTNIPYENVSRLVNYFNEHGGEVGHPYGLIVEIPVFDRYSTNISPDGRPLIYTIEEMRPGTLVNVCGRWVTDTRDNWNELHPVTYLNILPQLEVSVPQSQSQVLAGGTTGFTVKISCPLSCQGVAGSPVTLEVNGLPATYTSSTSGLPGTYTFTPQIQPTDCYPTPVCTFTSDLVIHTPSSPAPQPGVYQQNFQLKIQVDPTVSVAVPCTHDQYCTKSEPITASTALASLQVEYGCLDGPALKDSTFTNQAFCNYYTLSVSPGILPTSNAGQGYPWQITTSFTEPYQSEQPDSLLWVAVEPPTGNAYLCSDVPNPTSIYADPVGSTCAPPNFPLTSSFTPTTAGAGSSAVSYTCDIPYGPGSAASLSATADGGTSTGCSGNQPVWGQTTPTTNQGWQAICEGEDFPTFLTQSGSAAPLPLTWGDSSQVGTYNVYACWANVNTPGYSDTYTLESTQFNVLPVPGVFLTPVYGAQPVGGSILVYATVIDGNDNPVQGATVEFAVLSGPDSGGARANVTQGDGVAEFNITNNGGENQCPCTLSGVDTIQATYTTGGNTYESTIYVTWANPTVTLCCSGSGTTGGTKTVTATALDGNGNPVANARVEFTVISGPNKGMNETELTAGDGTASFTYNSFAASVPGASDGQTSIILGAGAGTDEINATWITLPILTCVHLGHNLVCHSTGGSKTYSNTVQEIWNYPTLTLSPKSGSQSVGGEWTVTGLVLDGSGNPLPGVAVTFRVSSGPNAGQTGTAVTIASCGKFHVLSCSPGQALFTYTDTGGAGSDVVVASFLYNGANYSSSLYVTVNWGHSTEWPTFHTGVHILDNLNLAALKVSIPGIQKFLSFPHVNLFPNQTFVGATGPIALDSKDNYLFAASNGFNGSSTIVAMSDLDGHVVANITIPVSSILVNDMSYDPSNGILYIASEYSNSTYLVDATTLKYVGSVPTGIGGYAPRLALDSQGGLLFITDDKTGALLALNTLTNTVVANVSLGYDPTNLAFDSTSNHVFVVGGFGNVTSLDASTYKIVRNIATPYPSGYGIAYDSANNLVYADSYSSPMYLSVINGTSEVYVKSISLGNATGLLTYSVFYAQGTDEIYIPSASGNFTWAVDTGTGQVTSVPLCEGTICHTLSTSCCSSGVYDPATSNVIFTVPETGNVSAISLPAQANQASGAPAGIELQWSLLAVMAVATALPWYRVEDKELPMRDVAGLT